LSFISNISVAINNISNLRLVIYGIHGDCHEDSVRNGLKKLSDAVLSITEPNFDGKGSAKCQVTSYKTKGKNSRVISNHYINSTLDFKRVEKIETTNTEEPEDVNLETTFNLGLKLSERQAKTQVELPFWRPEQRSNLTENPKSKSEKGRGAIIYVADETDDCDEEDPDDELNI